MPISLSICFTSRATLHAPSRERVVRPSIGIPLGWAESERQLGSSSLALLLGREMCSYAPRYRYRYSYHQIDMHN